jgi:hypothetical protein
MHPMGTLLSIKEVFEGKFCARISSQKPAFVSILAFFFSQEGFLIQHKMPEIVCKISVKIHYVHGSTSHSANGLPISFNNKRKPPNLGYSFYPNLMTFFATFKFVAKETRRN